MKQKVKCGELSFEITLLGLPHSVKAASETWPNPRITARLYETRSELKPV